MNDDQTYADTIEYLFAQLPMFQRRGKLAFKKDLANIRSLLDHLDHPEVTYPVIHVAGTNGKGTVSHLIASILQAGGYKTGLYTSPHYRDFRERIKVDGQLVEPDYVVEFTDRVRQNIGTISPSFFEITVAMAFDYFRRQSVEVAVVETGLGGRLDSTNVVDPLVSVITNIGMDHTDFLGTTLYEIAGEKAGIIKAGRPVVIGRYQVETDAVFFNKSRSVGSGLHFASIYWKASLQANSVNLTGRAGQHFSVALPPLHSPFFIENTVTTLEAIRVLVDRRNFFLDSDHVVEGIENFERMTNYLGRWKVLDTDPLILADSAHNEAAFQKVIDWMAAADFKNIHLVLGFVSDKSLDRIYDILPRNATYYWVAADIPRARTVDQLCADAMKCGLKGNGYISVTTGLNAARIAADSEDLIFVGGSSFVAAEVV